MGSDKNIPKMDFSFLWLQGIHLILDQKTNLGFSQRNAPPVPTPQENLNNLSFKQLREIIKEKGLRAKGLSKLKKKRTYLTH